MRKHDDELKIDISELFGGDLPSPSDTIDDSAAPAPTIPTPTVIEEIPATAPAEVDNKFQEWMNNRNAELEAKTQELEKRLQELQAQVAAKQTVPEVAQVPPSPPPAATEINAPTEPAADSPVDFSAPIAPPFMGGPVPSIPTLTLAPQATPEMIKDAEPSPETPKSGNFQKLQEDHEFLMLYDEFRNIIAHELLDLVGEKKTYTMLGRTVELARGKYPEIFRNVNWDASGNLLEDGSVYVEKIIENKDALDPQKAEVILDAALTNLLNLRLQAVEKGLGTGLKNKIRTHLIQWISEKIKKSGPTGKNILTLRRLNSYLG